MVKEAIRVNSLNQLKSEFGAYYTNAREYDKDKDNYCYVLYYFKTPDDRTYFIKFNNSFQKYISVNELSYENPYPILKPVFLHHFEDDDTDFRFEAIFKIIENELSKLF